MNEGHVVTPVCGWVTHPKPRCKKLPTDVVWPAWRGESVMMCPEHAKRALKMGYTRWKLAQ